MWDKIFSYIELAGSIQGIFLAVMLLGLKDYINRYRVEGVKTALQDAGNQNYTILTLAFEEGFRSKATFHAAFKKWAGCTPNEYLKKHTMENH